MTSWLIRCIVFFAACHHVRVVTVYSRCMYMYMDMYSVWTWTCTQYMFIRRCGQCGHRVVHKTCVLDAKKCMTFTAFSSRFCPDMQAASCKITLSHTIITALCVSGMKKWVSASFLRIGPKRKFELENPTSIIIISGCPISGKL